MPRGGARPGAGRKPGAVAKISNETRAKLVANLEKEGKPTPLEVMAENMGDLFGKSKTILTMLEKWAAEREEGDKTPLDLYREWLRLIELSQKCAVDLAPYMHAKLAAVAPPAESPNGQPGDDAKVINGEAREKFSHALAAFAGVVNRSKAN